MPPKGRVVVNEFYCKGCGLCVEVCPPKVLALAETRMTAKGYHPVEMASQDCTGCGVCAVMCPEAALTVYREILGAKVTAF